jgi:hypothetical protein
MEGLEDILPLDVLYKRDQEIMSMPAPTHATPAASKILLKEYRAMIKINDSPASPRVWKFKSRELENMYTWSVLVVEFDKELTLGKGKRVSLIARSG